MRSKTACACHALDFVEGETHAGHHIVNLAKPWGRILKVAGLEDVRIHDLRHTFASMGVANGLALPMIGGLLGHSQPATMAR